MCTFLLSYILIRSLSDDPKFVRSDIGCFYFINQVFNEAGHVVRSKSFSLSMLVLLSSIFISVDSVVFLILYTLLSVIIPFLYSFDIIVDIHM